MPYVVEDAEEWDMLAEDDDTLLGHFDDDVPYVTEDDDTQLGHFDDDSV